MAIGTRSLLYGVHCFLIHPFFVALAWFRLYGFPYDPRLWVAFFLHDVGYWGKPNMDGAEGERHPELGAAIVGFLFGPKWRDFTLLHSRSYARRIGRTPSRLCAADKMVPYYTPWWMYFPFACATGELNEYMARAGAPVQFNGFFNRLAAFRKWYAGLQHELKTWADQDLARSAEQNAMKPSNTEDLIATRAAFELRKPISMRTAELKPAAEKSQTLQLLTSCCLPAMIGMGAEAAYQLTSRMSVGRALGSEGLATIATAFPCSLL